jgi:hypothetical protein
MQVGKKANPCAGTAPDSQGNWEKVRNESVPDSIPARMDVNGRLAFWRGFSHPSSQQSQNSAHHLHFFVPLDSSLQNWRLMQKAGDHAGL